MSLVRVVVYNVRGFRAGDDALADVVRSVRPDILLLQESGARRTLRRFAGNVGMGVASDTWSPFRRRVKNAVLARPPWRIITHRLHRFDRSQRFYPRGALIAQVGGAGRRLWAISTHLGLVPVERRRHAEELVDLVRGLPGPVLIGGDLNDTPDGKAPRRLARRFRDAWAEAGDGLGATFPAAEASTRIDYLFVSDGVRVASAGVLEGDAAGTASDHRPVVVDVDVEGWGR